MIHADRGLYRLDLLFPVDRDEASDLRVSYGYGSAAGAKGHTPVADAENGHRSQLTLFSFNIDTYRSAKSLQYCCALTPSPR
jgi:hypothetical protein